MSRCNTGLQTVSQSLKYESLSRRLIKARGELVRLLFFCFPCFDFLKLVFPKLMMNRPT
jgi:hypothetical protein